MPQKITRDHAKKTQRPMVEDRVIADHLTALLTPTITSGFRFFRELELRERILKIANLGDLAILRGFSRFR